MLLSPGHSPRQLSTPIATPSSAGIASAEKTSEPPSSVTAAANSRKRRPAVLDEDTYVAAIEKIIERDFFPDIPKLRDRLDWLEAVRSGDPLQIRDAQLKILERRSAATATPGTSVRRPSTTPLFSATPFGTDPTAAATGAANSNIPTSTGDGDGDTDVDASLTLDEFFRRYTSEDNESFSRIMEKVNKKRKEKYAHLLKRDGEEPAMALEYDPKEHITDGYGTSGQPTSTLEGWKYAAKNLLMYNPSDRGEAPLTDEERAERAKALTKEINKSNTRFHGKSVDNAKPTMEDESVAILYTPVRGTTPSLGTAWPFADREAEKSKKYDLEELRKTPNPFYVESAKKAENGYSFVRTPSPAPGVDESPFITWGEIEGTPLRLDPEETPIDLDGKSVGPRFQIPHPPARDLKAHSLSREASRKLRERSKMLQKPPLPSPSRSGSMSPNVRTLSPAAQKFVRNAIAKSSSSVDETLRASYRGTSPAIGTPKGRIGSSRFSKDGSLASRSPSARQGSSPAW